jgi:hypothetical protein
MRLIKSADLERLHFEANNYKLNQQYVLAEESYRKLITLEGNMFGPETSTVALHTYNLAEVLVHQRRFEEARVLLQQAVTTWEKAHPNDYLSLLSYTEALNIVKRQRVVEAFEAQQAEDARESGTVLPLRRRTSASVVHVA